MMIQQLIKKPIEELEALTDKELEEYFSPMYNVTRPEVVARLKRAGQSAASSAGSKLDSVQAQKMAKARAIAQNLGFDLDDVL